MTRSMRQLTHGLSIAVVFLAGFLAIQSISADPATARVPKGVTIDHDSPSQKEYAIPLEEGRRTGRSRGITSNNSSSSSGSSGQTPQLFGEGVAPDSEHQRRTHSSNSPSEKSENGHATAKTATHRGNISSTQLAPRRFRGSFWFVHFY